MRTLFLPTMAALLLAMGSAGAATQITGTITITNATHLTGTNAESVTVNTDVRTITNAVYTPASQVLVGSTAAESAQRMVIQFAAYKFLNVTPSMTRPTNIVLLASNDVALSITLSPSTWGFVTYATQTVGAASVVRVPFSSLGASERTNIANQLIQGFRDSANSNAPALWTHNLAQSNATVKPVLLKQSGNSNQLFSLEASQNVGISMTPTSAVFSVGTAGLTNAAGTLRSSSTFAAYGAVKLADGIDKRMGTNAFASGTCLVTNVTVSSNSRIFLSTIIGSGTVGHPYIHSITNGVSFTVTNSSTGDNSVFAWLILDPAP